VAVSPRSGSVSTIGPLLVIPILTSGVVSVTISRSRLRQMHVCVRSTFKNDALIHVTSLPAMKRYWGSCPRLFTQGIVNHSGHDIQPTINIDFYWISMRFLILMICAFFLNSAVAQSSLPLCPPSGPRHNCQGEYIFPSGNKYRGEWKDGKFDGPGEMNFANGARLIGHFSDSGRKVDGTLYYSNGAKHVGEFLMGKPHGNGTQHRPDGTVAATGNWKDGVFEGSFNQSSQAVPPQSTGDSQKWAEARRMCVNYGFTPNTNPFAECVQREVHKQAASSSRVAEEDSRRVACQERNSAIESRVRQCKSNCNMSNLQALSAGRANLNQLLMIQNQKDACESQCNQQLSMQGEC
jgi:hypothetical protein